MDSLAFKDAARFEAWLAEHHDDEALTGGVWLRLAKKSSGLPSVRPDEVIDIALCYGWIDGQRKALDATHYLQKVGRRRPRSNWSQVNVRKVEALTAAGRMREPGFAEVAAAQADGRWAAAYPSQREATVPADLAAALADDAAARAAFARLGRSEAYALILGLHLTRTADGRAARVRRTVEQLRLRPAG
ncbi:YdeI family protein [Streptomyces monticola]|uniref:YdeI family protein n=1 Tax=Streptomyces monticola TaxID=2666263 RepID=A0ABW2JYU5_9ACTN